MVCHNVGALDYIIRPGQAVGNLDRLDGLRGKGGEGGMSHSRRDFLGAAVMLVARSAFGAPQVQQGGPPPKGDVYPQDTVTPRRPGHRPDPRAVLKANQEEIKKDVARLSDIVAELQKSLDENDTKEVLSLDVIHKTEEIEKLAKQIRSLVTS